MKEKCIKFLLLPLLLFFAVKAQSPEEQPKKIIVGFPLSLISSNAKSEEITLSAQTSLGWHLTKNKGFRAFSIFAIANDMQKKGEELGKQMNGIVNVTRALINHFKQQGYALNETDIPIFSEHAIEPILHKDGIELLQQLKESGADIIGISNHDTEEDHIYVQKMSQKASLTLPNMLARMIVVPYQGNPFVNNKQEEYYPSEHIFTADKNGYPSENYVKLFKKAAQSVSKNAQHILLAHDDDKLPETSAIVIRYSSLPDLKKKLQENNILS